MNLLFLLACGPEPTPLVDIVPDAPTTTDDLVAVVRGEGTLRWSVDGEDTELDGLVIPASDTAKGQTWSVWVTPDRGNGGHAVVEIANTPPTAELTIQPADPRPDDPLQVDVVTADADDDDVQTSVVWLRDGAVFGETVPAGVLRSGELWTAVVYADDGDAVSETSATVLVTNELPVVTFAELSPLQPLTVDPIVLDLEVEDPDGDPVQVDLTWTVDGTVVQEGLSASLDPSFTGRAQQVEVTVVASDPYDSAAPVTVGPVTVQNTAPELAAALLDPEVPDASTGASVIPVGATDLDGDPVDLEVRWHVDDQVVQVGTFLPGTAYERGQRLYAEVFPDDGLDLGSPVETLEVVIPNAPPNAFDIDMPGQVVPFDDDLVCATVGLGDADGDPLDIDVSWTLDDQPWTGPVSTTSLDDDTIAAVDVDHGRWRCTVTVSDGQAIAEASGETRAALDRNVLILVLDDISTFHVGTYEQHPEPVPTPSLDALAAEGIRFDRAYAENVCTPTRAASLSGRYTPRYGLGTILADNNPAIFPLGEQTIPEMLANSPWGFQSAAIGKWHLSLESNASLDHPRDQGFDTFRGVMRNLGQFGGGFYEWDFVVDGEYTEFGRTDYASTAQVDDALEWMEEVPQPWFMWLAFSAPHRPWHVPPDDLVTTPVDDDSTAVEKYRAAIEALDTEIGRLLAEMDPTVRSETTIIAMGDNGTPHWVLDLDVVPQEKAKDSLYEAGIRVPFIVAGPHVVDPGRQTRDLVHVVDLFPTIAELADVDPSTFDKDIDGVSFLQILEDPSASGQRETVFSARFAPVGGGPYSRDRTTLVGPDYKLWRNHVTGIERFYRLSDRVYDDGPALDPASLSIPEQQVLYDMQTELDLMEMDLLYEY